MVEQTTLSRKIDSRLRTLRRNLEALPLYVERLSPSSGGHVLSGADLDALHYEWRDTLDRFDGAHEWFLAGSMSDEQAERHRQNLGLLAGQLSTIRQLGLKLPSGPLLASLGTVEVGRTQAEPA